jgi:hypothetical protein
MFLTVNSDNARAIVDLHETSGILEVLLRLLHDPPIRPQVVVTKKERIHEDEAFLTSRPPKDVYDLTTVIPFPILLTPVLEVADKYILSESVLDTLHEHLKVHAETYALPVFAYASNKSMHTLAAYASQFLHPLAHYKEEDVALIPSVKEYHQLVKLQHHRLQDMRTLLLGESIFPHGTLHLTG